MIALTPSDRQAVAAWTFPRWLETRTLLVILLALGLLVQTGRSVEIDRMVRLSVDAVLAAAGADVDSQVARGAGKIVGSLFPLQIQERTEVSRIEGFDRADLPIFSHLESVETQVQRMNPDTLEMEIRTERAEYLVEPFGYLLHVGGKLVETLEIALWGTVIAVVLSMPLAFFSAANLTTDKVAYTVARAVVSWCRAVPELVSALFLVMAYGFGPIAGVLALALYSAGFLGKFFAEDIENADVKPQEALRAIGCNRLKVLRHAILPEVLPQYIAYMLYVLDRNVRTATVIGIVGAGGIGQELKGRFDMFNYQHVGTILVAIFVMVFAIDQLAARLRRRYL
jgi:phosphonate transport system permease protein